MRTHAEASVLPFRSGSQLRGIVPSSERLLAVDAGRGFMMFLQISHPFLVTGVFPLLGPGPVREFLARHLAHSQWHGVHYLDLGLPGYVAAMGMAIHLALQRARTSGVTGRNLIRPILLRALLLFALGILCNGGLRELWPHVRIAGVLQRLAICYALGCAVAWNSGWRVQIGLVVGLLLGYWALMQYAPFPGAPADRFAGLANLAVFIDERYLPGAGLYGTWDPEGLLTTLPAVATCIAGVLLGHLFTSPLSTRSRSLALLALGAGGLTLGKLWAPWFPLNKYMWTSSFVLVALGAISLHVWLLWWVADVWGYRKLVLPFLIYGRHSLAAYVGDQLIDFEWIALALVGGSVALTLGPFAGLALALTVIGLQFGLVYWLDRSRSSELARLTRTASEALDERPQLAPRVPRLTTDEHVV